jgi:hypothetical protein
VGPRAHLDAVAKRKNPIVAAAGRPARSPVPILTELLRLPSNLIIRLNYIYRPSEEP